MVVFYYRFIYQGADAYTAGRLWAVWVIFCDCSLIQLGYFLYDSPQMAITSTALINAIKQKLFHEIAWETPLYKCEIMPLDLLKPLLVRHQRVNIRITKQKNIAASSIERIYNSNVGIQVNF